ncbi:MAG TPA: hypothetical protein PJ988_07660, partial [Anaerolinea sp.]|nr:hypothetical protein [Anaerolinea sp.]
WDFEMQGSIRSQSLQDRFYCMTKRRHGVEYIFTAVVNGEWIDEAKEYAKTENIVIQFDQLPLKPMIKRYLDRLRGLAYRYSRKIKIFAARHGVE